MYHCCWIGSSSSYAAGYESLYPAAPELRGGVHVSDTVAEPVVYLIGLGCIPVRLPAQAAESLWTLRPSRSHISHFLSHCVYHVC